MAITNTILHGGQKNKILYVQKGSTGVLRSKKLIAEINGISLYDHKRWTEDLNQIPRIMLLGMFVYMICGVNAYNYG